MKKTYFLMLFVTLFGILLNVAAFAYGDHIDCDEVGAKRYCQYQGALFGDLSQVDEEFKMLLEPHDHPNCQHMFGQLLYKIVTCSEKYMEVLKNPHCNISQYTKKLLRFYKANRTEILKADLSLVHEEDGNMLVEILDDLKQRLGDEFLLEKTEYSFGYLREYCNFSGLTFLEYSGPEQFALLLENKNSPNFQKIISVIARLAVTPPEDLNDPKCRVYKCTREFLDWYKKNKRKITKDKYYLKAIFDIIQETAENPGSKSDL